MNAEPKNRVVAEEEVARFYATSTGHNDGGVHVFGPVLVSIVVRQSERIEDGFRFAPTYVVVICGREQCSGFTHHLPENPVEMMALSFLVNRVPVELAAVHPAEPVAVCWCDACNMTGRPCYRVRQGLSVVGLDGEVPSSLLEGPEFEAIVEAVVAGERRRTVSA